MASFKCAILLAVILLATGSHSQIRRSGLFSHLSIRNAHPEDKAVFTPPPQTSSEMSVGMEQTVPELLPTSQRQISNDLFSGYGTELNDFLKELERYVAIAGRPRFGRSTDAQVKELNQDKVDSTKQQTKLSEVPELQITIKICHGHSVCVVPRIIRSPLTH